MTSSLADNLAGVFEIHNNNTPPWLEPHRREAFDNFQKLGWPTRNYEDWKYTDLTGIKKINFLSAVPKQYFLEKKVVDRLRSDRQDVHELIFINGHYSDEYSSIGNLPKDVVITNMRTALTSGSAIFKKIFNRCADNNKHNFTALNTALFNDGACVYIPDNVTIKQPIILRFISGSMEQEFSVMPRNLIILGERARASILERFHSIQNMAGFTNTVTEAEISAGAVLEYYKEQQCDTIQGFHIGTTYFKQHHGSSVRSHYISLGGNAIVRNDIHVQLLAEGAEVDLNGIYLGEVREHIDNQTTIRHAASHTCSDEHYRGILDGRARGVFNGRVIVEPNIQGIRADQFNANLLLSDYAEIDTKPELQIHADDVKCSHGATVGQLDKDMLFYLRSRGLSLNAAKNLLLFAFINNAIIRIKSGYIRKQLEHRIIKRLSVADLIGYDGKNLG